MLVLDRQRVPSFVVLSISAAVVYLLAVGIVTAVIPTPLFVRMTPVTISNLVFWIVPASSSPGPSSSRSRAAAEDGGPGPPAQRRPRPSSTLTSGTPGPEKFARRAA